MTYHPAAVKAGWAGHRFRLGKIEEVFGAECYALVQALKILEERG